MLVAPRNKDLSPAKPAGTASQALAKFQDFQPVILFRVFPGRSLNQQRQTAIERLGLQPFPGKQIPVLKVTLHHRVDPNAELNW